MLKTMLAAAALSLSLVTSAVAGPGQPPAIKSWTILSIASWGPQTVMSTYGTYRTQSACVSALKSIVAKNPYLNEYNGVPIGEYDVGATVMCVPGTGGSVMQSAQ